MSAKWGRSCSAFLMTFLVLSGDDALTLPLMALGGKGIISVASNEIPGEMAQLAQLCLDGQFEARVRCTGNGCR